MKKPLIIILSIIGIILLIGIGFFIYMKITYLSKDEIKQIITKDTGVKSSDIYFENIDLETENNSYEVEFYYNNIEYEYKIDAKNGRIIYNNFKINTNQNTNTNNNQNNSSSANNQTTASIQMDKAKEIALNDAKADIKNVTFTEAKQDYDNGRLIYEIEFIYNNVEYNYEIDAITGEIVHYDIDR